MSDKKLTSQTIFAYGSLGIPLGFIGMPLYVYLPKFYAEQFGISLITLSVLLLATRLIDTIQDPLIGWYSDHLIHKKNRYLRVFFITLSLPILSVLFLALLYPQSLFSGALSPVVWIGISLVLTYTTYSLLTINYNTMAAELTSDYHQQTKLVSGREGIMLVGIASGSIIPSFFLSKFEASYAHFLTWSIFLVLAIIAGYIFYQKAPRPSDTKPATENLKKAFFVVIKHKPYLFLAGVYLLSTIAAAIPATIVLFYIKDVLAGEAYFGIFLGIYFLCALAGLPLWFWISKHLGKVKTWSLSMIGSIIGFIWATFLGPGDFIAYGIICIVTGLCLGADLSMPFSLLADTVKSTDNKSKYYAVWGMLAKSSLAIAGSLGLFALGSLGYDPNEAVTEGSRLAVSISYALIPCVIKLGSLIALTISPLEKQETST